MGNISVPLLQIFVSAFVALMVVALSHAFATRRDRQDKRQEQRLNYLISVYRAFCKANHHPYLYEVAEEIEQAVSDVQLFGTPEQVRLVQQFADVLGTRQEAPLDDLLLELGDSLRFRARNRPSS